MEFIIQTESDNSIFKQNGFPELVRCKDCKRYIEQAHECEALNQGCIKPDFFCGYGIRKDGDGG